MPANSPCVRPPLGCVRLGAASQRQSTVNLGHAKHVMQATACVALDRKKCLSVFGANRHFPNRNVESSFIYKKTVRPVRLKDRQTLFPMRRPPRRWPEVSTPPALPRYPANTTQRS